MDRGLHALVIGGTGMLSGVSIHLAEDGYAVSVIGRSKEKFEALAEGQKDALFLLNGDYNSNDIFTLVSEAIESRGPFDVIVGWISNNMALEQICRLNEGAENFILIHVKGSGRFFQDTEIQIEPNCNYRKVFLGFKLEHNVPRWLTHQEICNGVIQQFRSNEKVQVVGQIHPYEKRPE